MEGWREGTRKGVEEVMGVQAKQMSCRGDEGREQRAGRRIGIDDGWRTGRREWK